MNAPEFLQSLQKENTSFASTTNPKTNPNRNRELAQNILMWCLSLFVGAVYYFSNPYPNSHYDYTWRIAESFWRGHLDLGQRPPPWLNEFVPFQGRYYSVFPLGSVLSMMPLQLGKFAGLWVDSPAALIVACIGASTTWFCWGLSSRFCDSIARRVLLSLFPTLATWMWCNLCFAGAWQIALGFAVLGQCAALHFSLVSLRPLLAGFCFALAFGNRTEVLLTAPCFIWLLLREEHIRKQGRVVDLPQNVADAVVSPEGRAKNSDMDVKFVSGAQSLRHEGETVERFCFIPAVLCVATLWYNYARFGSSFDFGYARIPGILKEHYYRNGIFSLWAIPDNAQAMLLDGWKYVAGFPHYVPSGWGGSLFLACPLLILLFRRGNRDRAMMIVAWLAIVTLTFVLWLHGNPGGWQYSYRYAMVLLPWFFLILIQGNRAGLKAEIVLFVLSVAINAWGTYLFYRTQYITL